MLTAKCKDCTWRCYGEAAEENAVLHAKTQKHDVQVDKTTIVNYDFKKYKKG